MSYLQEKINEYTYRFDAENSVYLVVGTKRAALIDTGMAKEPFLHEIRSITNLPLIVLLTHGHPDHIGRTIDFDDVYMSRLESEVYQTYQNDVACLPLEKVHLFDGEPHFDLGGITLETIALEGHTKGSVCYVERQGNQVFSGDALGSGLHVWMQLPESCDISTYKMALYDFKQQLGEGEWQFYPGHYTQRKIHPNYEDNPVNLRLIDDAMCLCDLILDGKTPLKDTHIAGFGQIPKVADYKHMEIILNQTKVK